ncbi:MAG TPA: SpoIIE family protein phosphatase [Candidatus Sulfotelmatobacter sp.]|jgi:serine phosphatase RsbU (regulator of sigma subunit)/energy-coupling factor transporter ATP-binding protein EcfA2|nr:SpoIIE family protein phosphatase [Candidatus Sulfotelmatobacter sp.]
MTFASIVQRHKLLANPYPGLRPFETSEAHLFFGRDQQITELVNRLERNRFLAIVGVSGSGKSSLVRAGLLPAIERGRVGGSGSKWRIIVIHPGGTPVSNLEAALREAGLHAAGLRQSTLGLVQVAAQLPRGESLLVIIDQFEEIFRYEDIAPITEEARRRKERLSADAHDFVQLLLGGNGYPSPLHIILTMRSDYLGECAEFRDFPETLNETQYLVPRLTREQRKQAIEYPLGNVEIEPPLVQQLLNDAGDEPDQLPILQHALMRTWTHWNASNPERNTRLGLANYEAIGGFKRALDQHATELLKDVRLDYAETVFKRLATRGGKNQDRRNPATLGELWDLCGAEVLQDRLMVNNVVDHFRQREATFLLPREEDLRFDTYVDISHESLIRQWGILRDQWLPDETKSAQTFLDLAQRARNWKLRGGPLLTGLDLTDAEQWNSEHNPTSRWAEQYADEKALADVGEYIEASQLSAGNVSVEEAARRYSQELAIASEIQTSMMKVVIPDLPYAKIKSRISQCKEIGGDFFEVTHSELGIGFVVGDVSGKGVGAAVVASALQGIFSSQLSRNIPLEEIVASANTYLCEKIFGQKYATLLAGRLIPTGELQWVNAGLVAPFLLASERAARLPNERAAQHIEDSDMPVGLISSTGYRVHTLQLSHGDRFLIMTDGIIEAENSEGDFFGDGRAEAASSDGFEALITAVSEFCGSTPRNDDWTLVEITYGVGISGSHRIVTP